MEDRRVRTIDVEAFYREVREFCAEGCPGAGRAPRCSAASSLCAAWYRGWHEGMIETPFYAVNSRV